MSSSALALALTAAFLHALWNLQLAGAADSESAAAVALLGAVACFAPLAAIGADVQTQALPYVAASSALELLYVALLGAAYVLVLFALERAPAAPVAAVRESSVVIATALAAIFLSEAVGTKRLAGSALVAGGVAVLALV